MFKFKTSLTRPLMLLLFLTWMVSCARCELPKIAGGQLRRPNAQGTTSREIGISIKLSSHKSQSSAMAMQCW